jgi:alpha-L-fucosidase
MSFEDRQQSVQKWNPEASTLKAWMQTSKQSGMKMFVFTTKHHEGFSMFDTSTRVKSRTNWVAPAAQD